MLFLAAFFLIQTASPAQACRVAQEPFNPAKEKSDVVIAGQVYGTNENGAILGKWFSVRIEQVFMGEFTENSYSTGWPIGTGACGPRGPDVQDGDWVSIYLNYREGKLIEQGWTIISRASPPK